MLQGDLTFDRAVEIAGSTQQFLEWRIGVHDPFVKCYKEISDLIDEILASGLATSRLNFLGSDLTFQKSKEARVVKRRLVGLEGELGNLFNKRFRELKLKWDQILGDELPQFHDRVDHIIREFILNAIEHGSDFCKENAIAVDVRLGVGSVLCSITQPRKLPDISSKCQALSDDPFTALNLFYKTKVGRNRGSGMFNAAFDFYHLVGFENLESGGGRVVIVETHDRALEVHRQIIRQQLEK